jgi:two-component system, sensor histidine kinase PdtaS
MERLFLATIRSRGLPVWARYGTTTLLVLACLQFRLWLLPPDGGVPFLMFVPAVVLAGVIFDRGTGIYASLLSAVLAVVFFVKRTSPLQIAEPSDMIALLVFLGITLFTAFILEALHTAFHSFALQRVDLDAANAQLRHVAEEKATLLSEAVHRASNDLQRLAASLSLQAKKTTEPAARQALREALDRVLALARINQRLDRHRDDGQADVDSKGFIEGLAEDLRQGAVGMRPLTLCAVAESHVLPMAQAVPIGLIINELVTNALKYAFPEEAEGTITIGLRREGSDFVVLVEDDGVGFDPAAPPHGSGLGTRISRSLARQLGGHLEAAPAAPGANRPGMRWIIRLPTSSPEPTGAWVHTVAGTRS